MCVAVTCLVASSLVCVRWPLDIYMCVVACAQLVRRIVVQLKEILQGPHKLRTRDSMSSRTDDDHTRVRLPCDFT